MEASSARSTQKFSALTPDLFFEFPEKLLIVLAYRVNQTRNEQVVARLWNRKKSADEFAGAGAFPFGARKAGGINKSARFTSTVKKAFFVETIESGHDRRVCERALQFIDDIANVAVAVLPENFHHAFFEMAE
jgi:hypothetical protein